MAYNNVKVKPRQTVTQSTSQTKELGVVSEVPMGEWNATTQYEKLNKVRYVSTGGSGVTLLAKKPNQGVEPFVSQGWQEVWMVENYDGGAVSPDGTYPDMTVGNAANAQNDGNGDNIVEQFSNINEKIPSTASAENQLADKAFVNSSINNSAAFYITYTQGNSTESGQAFPTHASLINATTFYSGGQVRVPTQNDYAIVRADESQPQSVDGSYPTTRYSYQGGTYPNGQWDFQYIVNNTTLTQAQIDAINSGITSELVNKLNGLENTVIKVDGVPAPEADFGTEQDSGITMKYDERPNGSMSIIIGRQRFQMSEGDIVTTTQFNTFQLNKFTPILYTLSTTREVLQLRQTSSLNTTSVRKVVYEGADLEGDICRLDLVNIGRSVTVTLSRIPVILYRHRIEMGQTAAIPINTFIFEVDTPTASPYTREVWQSLCQDVLNGGSERSLISSKIITSTSNNWQTGNAVLHITSDSAGTPIATFSAWATRQMGTGASPYLYYVSVALSSITSSFVFSDTVTSLAKDK